METVPSAYSRELVVLKKTKNFILPFFISGWQTNITIIKGNTISRHILLKNLLAADTDTPNKSDKVE